MRQRTLIVVAALACSAALAWFVFDLGSTSARPVGSVEAGPVAPASGGNADLSVPTVPGSAAPLTPERVVAANTPGAAPSAHPWKGQLAGLTGRLLEHDGVPAVGLSVDLMQVDSTLLLRPESTPLGQPSFGIDSGRTDAEGRFHLGGAFRDGFHVLGIDRGGPRSALRVVERALELNEVVDLGDITLAAYGTLIGTVIDEDGNPVAGARVRFAAVPEVVVQTGALDLRSDSLIHVNYGPMGMTFALPRLIADALESLPVPTTHTAKDGSFRLAGVPIARLVGGVDHPGFVATQVPALDMEGGEHDLGELELTVGRTLSGRVVDRAGQPIAGADVRAGTLLAIAPVGVLQPTAPTDAAGRFSLTGVPEMGKVVGFARRNPSDAWVAAKAGPNEEVLEFQLETVGPVRIQVTSFEGEPVSGARFAFTPRPSAEDEVSIALFLQTARARDERTVQPVREFEPGVYVVEALSHGSWEVEVEAVGQPALRQHFDHHGTDTQVRVQCQPGERLTVRVLDTESKPIESAHVSIVASQVALLEALASDWTDRTGVAELGPFVLHAGEESSSPRRGGPMMDPVLRVVHPRYSDALLPLVPGQKELQVTLSTPCAIEGRVHWGGAVPDRSYMLLLERRGMNDLAEAFAMPRLNLTLPDGTFRFRGLTPGRYKLTLAERFLAGDPIALIVAQSEPIVRFEEEFDLTAIAPMQVDIDLTPSGLGPTTRVVGTVHVNGSPLQGASVSLRDNEKREMLTDANGRYAFEDVPAHGHVQVQIEGEVTLPDGTLSRRMLGETWQELNANEEFRFDVDVQLASLVVLVIDALTQIPIGGAAVATGRGEIRALTGRDEGTALTDNDGRATLSVDQNERLTIEVSAEGYADAQAQVKLDEKEAAEHRIELVRGVRCKGKVIFLPSHTENQWCYLSCTPVSGGTNLGTNVNSNDDYSFEFTAVAPGRYTATIYTNSAPQSAPVEFEVGPNGIENLELEYRAQD